jgi:hypothetical protein
MQIPALMFLHVGRGTRNVLVFFSIVLLCGCARRSPQVELKGETMGTSYTVKIVPRAGDEPDPAGTQAGIDAVLKKINAQMSVYDPRSEISRFNRQFSNEPVEISPEFLHVVDRAFHWSDLQVKPMHHRGTCQDLPGFLGHVLVDLVRGTPRLHAKARLLGNDVPGRAGLQKTDIDAGGSGAMPGDRVQVGGSRAGAQQGVSSLVRTQCGVRRTSLESHFETRQGQPVKHVQTYLPGLLENDANVGREQVVQVIEVAFCHHRPGTPQVLLIRLEKELDGSFDLVPIFSKVQSQEQAHRGMGVMPAHVGVSGMP